jgi:enamine deaminase RidA (YjgF/YER057c/UK114 family)
MNLFNGDLITLRSEKNFSDLYSQTTDCLQQLNTRLVERDLPVSAVYKIIIYLDHQSANSGTNHVRDLLYRIKQELHKEILIIPLFQAPLECDLLMEVYYSVSPEWKRTLFLHSSGGVILFEHDGLSVSNGFSASNTGDCITDSDLAFKTLQQLLSETGFEILDITRQWNYIEGILSSNERHQHYQIFNDARTKFYEDHFREKGYPAATGIGMQKGGILIEYIAIRGDQVYNVPMDNPQQIPAHQYHPDCLMGVPAGDSKTTPKFERGRFVDLQGEEVFFISGTAAIMGEKTANPGDAEQQTRLTINNIDRLVSKDNLLKNNIEPRDLRYNYLRIYLKHKKDFRKVREICLERYGSVPIVWLQADICRKDLEVEIEGTLLVNK